MGASGDNRRKTQLPTTTRRDLVRRTALGGAAFALSERHGPETAQAQPVPKGRCKTQKIKVWLKGFIPGNIPGQTEPVPGAPGKMMVDGSLLPNFTHVKFPGCFYTDHRDFSNDPAASARLHSYLEIDVASSSVYQRHWCTPTVRVDCTTGNVECRKAAVNSGHFDQLGIQQFYDKARWLFRLGAAASDPCAVGSPDVDYEGYLSIDLSEGQTRVDVSFFGRIDTYPAFEMYAQVDEGEPKTMMRIPIPSGNSPLGLFGYASRPVKAKVTIITGACGYHIRDRTRLDSSRHGPGYDVTFDARLAPDPNAPGEWLASGSWGGQQLRVLINPGECSKTTMESVGGEVVAGLVTSGAGYLNYELISQPVVHDFIDESVTFGLISDDDIGTAEERSFPYTAGRLMVPMDDDVDAAAFQFDDGVIQDGGGCLGLVTQHQWVQIERVHIDPKAPPQLPKEPPDEPDEPPVIPGPPLS